MSDILRKIKKILPDIETKIFGGLSLSYKNREDIDVITFKKMIDESVNQLKENQEYLNRLNVFPVPDGDTGTNMLNTMIGVKNSLEALSDNSFGVIGNEIVKSILLSARGNIGVILSAYLKGFILEIQNADMLTSSQLVRALEQGSDYAWKSICDPQRGTILDTFFAAAQGAREAQKDKNDIDQILDMASKYALIALKKTQYIQPQMRRAHVVDAGGAGFLFMLDGLRIGLLKGNHTIISGETYSIPTRLQEEDIPFQYCAEAVLRRNNTTLEELRRSIKDLGNSLKLVQENDIIKLHIHTNQPGAIEEICTHMGQVIDWNVDDMREMQKQYLASLHDNNTSYKVSPIPRSITKNKIAVVTDRSSDIPDGWIQQYPVFVVDIPVVLANDLTDLGEENSLREFYHRMALEKDFVPITSQPNVEQFIEAYMKALQVADIVFCITISSKLSGAYMNAVQAKVKLRNNKIYVIDSQSISVGLAILVKLVFDCQTKGKSYLDTLAEVYSLRDKMEQYFVVDSIKYLGRGGRLNRRQSLLGQTLDVHPLLHLKNGSINEADDKLYYSTPEKQMLMLSKHIQRTINKRELIFLYIVHSDAEARAFLLKKYLEENANLPKELIQISEFGIVTGAHVGPGAVAVYCA